MKLPSSLYRVLSDEAEWFEEIGTLAYSWSRQKVDLDKRKVTSPIFEFKNHPLILCSIYTTSVDDLLLQGLYWSLNIRKKSHHGSEHFIQSVFYTNIGRRFSHSFELQTYMFSFEHFYYQRCASGPDFCFVWISCKYSYNSFSLSDMPHLSNSVAILNDKLLGKVSLENSDTYSSLALGIYSRYLTFNISLALRRAGQIYLSTLTARRWQQERDTSFLGRTK
jgi:hypothetical protein